MARIARIGMMEVFWGGLPFYIGLWLTLMLVTYVPWFSTFLPNLFMK
jgi:TRAP-type C4-dicarboxylate transport system permease large subunit